MELTLILNDDIHVFPPRGVPRHIVGDGGTIAALDIVAHLPQRKHGIRLLRLQSSSKSCDSDSCDSKWAQTHVNQDSKASEERRWHSCLSQTHGIPRFTAEFKGLGGKTLTFMYVTHSWDPKNSKQKTRTCISSSWIAKLSSEDADMWSVGREKWKIRNTMS